MQDKFTLIIPAAGEGKRLGKGTAKAFIDLAGIPMVCRTMAQFEDVKQITQRVVAVRSCDVELAKKHLSQFNATVVEGGRRRQDSVRAALSQAECPYVAIHDAARPFVSPSLIERVLQEAVRHGAAIAAAPVTDTIKRAQAGIVAETVSRDGLWAAQTPQAFKAEILRNAFDHPQNRERDVTDDAQLLEALGVTARIVEGEAQNLKITTPEDLGAAIYALKKNGSGR